MASDVRKPPLPRRSLRAMKRRWTGDYDRLEEAYPVHDWEESSPASETLRNLATAIAQIDGLITCTRIGDNQGTRARATLESQRHD